MNPEILILGIALTSLFWFALFMYLDTAKDKRRLTIDLGIEDFDYKDSIMRRFDEIAIKRYEFYMNKELRER